MVWPFTKRTPRVYNPNAPKMRWEIIPIVTVVMLSLIFLWMVSYLFGIGGIAPVGPILMVLLFTVIVLLSLTIVKQRQEGREASQKDFALIMVLVVLLILGYVFLPDLAPEIFAQSVSKIKIQGLQAFITP